MPSAAPPTFMAPDKAGQVIRARADPRTPLTVADAAAQAGLAMRDADSGLKWLSSEFRGQLRVTNEGGLVHVFPYGFTKPWERPDAVRRAARVVGRALMSALRFVVRAWVSVVLVGYAAFFVALLLAMTFARQGNDSRRNDDMPGGALAYAFLRVVGDALFWTFHPWSPFSVYGGSGAWGGSIQTRGYAASRRSREERVPLYERVNRFFFGPSSLPEDPRENERRVLAAIRAGKGRVGLADVMRVTGLPRDEADPMMARLMLDYEGDVGVSEEGGIFYRFEGLRKTALEGPAGEAPPPAWTRTAPLAPLTGNSLGANVAIVALNAFNLAMGLWVIDNRMTLERLGQMFARVPHPIVGAGGVPIALGVIPVIFSALLFLVPIGRLISRPWRARTAEAERGRLAVLREVLERVRAKKPVAEAAVSEAWTKATGRPAAAKRLDRELIALGGDIAIGPGGETRWRFADLETEAAAVAAEREAATEDEARLGKVAFATDRD